MCESGFYTGGKGEEWMLQDPPPPPQNGGSYEGGGSSLQPFVSDIAVNLPIVTVVIKNLLMYLLAVETIKVHYGEQINGVIFFYEVSLAKSTSQKPSVPHLLLIHILLCTHTLTA